MATKDTTTAAKELRERGIPELQSLLAQKRDELQKAKLKHAMKQLRTTHVMRTLKRDVARINTVLAQRAQAGSKA